MKILKATYLENGYFSVLYSNYNTEIIQDITAIKMQVPIDRVLKDLLLFNRRLKLEKLTNKDFDDLNYRDTLVFEDKTKDEESERIKQMLKQMTTISDPDLTFDTNYLVKKLGLK